MSITKRWIGLLLVLCLLLSVVPVTANAVTASGTCGDNLTWSLSDDGVLMISGSGPMTNYYSNKGSPWSSFSTITSVVIGDDVTTIGNYAFNECTNLTSVEIGDSVTTIGHFGFFSCDSLTSVVIPDSVTTIGDQAFTGCNSLTSVEIGDTVTIIGNVAFW